MVIKGKRTSSFSTEDDNVTNQQKYEFEDPDRNSNPNQQGGPNYSKFSKKKKD